MRGMERALTAAVFIGAMLGVSSSAMAAAGFTYTTVKPLSGSATTAVTYSKTGSKPLNSLLAYQFNISNISGNTINNIVVQGTAVAKNAAPNYTDELITFSSSDGASCQGNVAQTIPAPGLSFNCTIGQLKAGASQTFTVFLNAPLQGANTATGDYADVRGITVTAEGANKGASQNDSVDFWPLTTQTPAPDVCDGAPLDSTLTTTTHPCVKVALGTPDGKRLKSGVSKAGGSFYTGNAGVPGYSFLDPDTNTLKPDILTTTVNIPQSSIIADAAVTDDQPIVSVGQGCVNFVSCSFLLSSLAINDVATSQTANYVGQPTPFLTFILRIDSSNILPGANVNKVKVFYNGAEVTQSCPLLNGSPVATGNDIPCIASRVAYKKNPGRNLDPALSLDFEITILNNKNGTLEFF